MTDTNEPEVTIDTEDPKPTPPDVMMVASLVAWANGKGPDIQSKVLELVAAVEGNQRTAQLEAFLDEYEALCRKHKMEISADDEGLRIDDYLAEGSAVAREASDDRETPEAAQARRIHNENAAKFRASFSETETLTAKRANERVQCYKILEARGSRYSPTAPFPWEVVYGTNEVRIAIVFKDDDRPLAPWVSFEAQVTEPVRWSEFVAKLERGPAPEAGGIGGYDWAGIRR